MEIGEDCWVSLQLAVRLAAARKNWLTLQQPGAVSGHIPSCATHP